MKRFSKYLLILFFIPFLSFTSVSLLFSNEKSLIWLFESVSEELGFQSKIIVSDLDWSLTKSRIFLSGLSIKEKDRANSIYSDSVILSIDLLNLVSSIDLYPFNLIKQKNFLSVELDQATMQLKDLDLNEIYSTNKFTNYILKNSLLFLGELNIRGSIREIDIPKYYYLFLNNGNGISPKINLKDVFISKVKLGPLELIDTNLEMKDSSNNLEFIVSNSELEGKVLVKKPIKKGIEVFLSSLKLNSENIDNSNLFEYLLDNLYIPISFSVGKLFIEEKDIGRVSFLLNKDKQNLYFKKIQFDGIDFNFGNNLNDYPLGTGSLSVFRKDDLINSSFQGNISTKNMSQSILSWRSESNRDLNFLAGESNLTLDIIWEGLPDEIDIKNIEGDLSFRIDNFVIKKAETDILGASDFLRLINLFNVSNTFGDLTNINFRKKFDKGFQADRVEGSFKIKKDQIKTMSPIIFSSGSGEFKWTGFIDKTTEGKLENLDFDIVMTLPLREYLPAYALILGGPVTAATVFIAGKAFKKPLNKLSSGKWKVTGTIENPNTEFLEWFE